MSKHLPTLGILFMVWGGIQVLIGIALPVIYLVFGAALGVSSSSGDDQSGLVVGGLMAGIGVTVGCLVLVMAIPNLLAGYGIRRRKKWARILGIVMGALALTSFPLGTALGIFALVVLLNQEVGQTFQVAAAEAG